MEAGYKRSLRLGGEYNRYFPVSSLEKSDPVIVQNGNVFDTILEMERIVKKTLPDTKEIAPLLQAGNAEQTCRNVWNFVYQHIQYTLDKSGVEQLRRPARTWHDRKAGVDCDCYSIFISSILMNLGIDHYFRMTKYNGKPDFQHIYIIVPKKLGQDLSRKNNYYALDCVVDSFDKEVPFSQKHDKKMMPIQYLNGLESNSRPGWGAEFIGIGETAGLGATPSLKDIGIDLLTRTKIHLENTRDMLKKVPGIIPNSKTYLAQLEFVLKSWDDPEARSQALEIVSKDGISGLNGWFSDAWDSVKTGVSNATQWVGNTVSSGANAVATGVSNATQWVGNTASNLAQNAAQVAQSAGQAIIKYNPVSVAIRNGLLLALKINLFHMSERLGYGYWEEATAIAKGMNVTEYRKLKEKLETVKKIHAGLQGDLNILKKNILEGWEHGTKKHNLLRGLGEPATATGVAAAIPVITTILGLLSGIDWSKIFGSKPAPDYSGSNSIPPDYDFTKLDKELNDGGSGDNGSSEKSNMPLLLAGGGILAAILFVK